jgi:glycosyltransferase involved in cell wall biosynthesis
LSQPSSRPLVSVIIAVKNGERFLASAIRSVLAQTYRPYEIIVVDGQSQDATAAIARSFADVRYIWQTSRGVAEAYNMGLEAALGDFIAFLSHDDEWTPDKLAVQIGYLIEHPEIYYTVARVKFFVEPGYSSPPGFRPEWLEGDHVAFLPETLVARRAVFDLVGRFDPAVSPADDVDWFARAKDLGIPVAVISQILLRKRIHNTNTVLTTPENDHLLLTILRNSLARKRQQRR